MNNKNKVIITYGLWLIDMVTIAIMFVLATYIRFGNFRDMYDKNSHFMVGVFCVLFATIYTFIKPWHNGFMRRGIWSELWRITKMNVIMVLTVQTVMYFLKWADTFSRWVMVYFVVLDIAGMLLFHFIFKQGMKTYYSSELVKTKVIAITGSDVLESVEEKLNKSLGLNYQLLEVIDIESISEDFFKDMMTKAIDEVFIYAPNHPQSKINRVISFFDDMGVICNYCVEIPDLDTKRSSVGSFGEYSVITYSHFQKSYKKLMLKRLMDIVGGLIGCIITVIFTPFVALAIKLNSKGPVFFSQVRIGRNGRRFKILKFRSMYVDAEDRKKELMAQNEVDGLMFKMENDPRITKVGAFIRKTSIDELPQFFNILKGDMSLVGTRPPTVDEFEKYNQYYRRRLSMTPGLTGLWQVSGRSDIDNFDEVVKLDLRYIDEWSLKLDMKILFKTIAVVFTGKGSK